MPHNPKQLQSILAAAVPDVPLTFKPMFGGILAYADGKPLASLSDVGLALKLTGANHAALLATQGAAALRYEPESPVSKTYVVVPETILQAPAEMRHWTQLAIAGLPALKARKTVK